MQPDDEALLADILIAARRVQSFMSGRSREDLDEDYQLQFAVQKGIEIIGEAAGRLTEAARTRGHGVPWRDIIGMRHRLVHDYGRVDLGVLWEVIESDIPLLIAVIAPLLPPPEDPEESA
jgi:uncharacterized protein with HEPN domain